MRRFSDVLIEAFIGGFLYMIILLIIIEMSLQFKFIKYRYWINKCYIRNRKYILLFIFLTSFLCHLILEYSPLGNINKLFCNMKFCNMKFCKMKFCKMKFCKL